MRYRPSAIDSHPRSPDDQGLSLLVVAFGLIITALLVLWVAKATLFF